MTYPTIIKISPYKPLDSRHDWYSSLVKGHQGVEIAIYNLVDLRSCRFNECNRVGVKGFSITYRCDRLILIRLLDSLIIVGKVIGVGRYS